MSIATRCPACGTVFRVVRDQLKVSEGWVRCGRCSEVFNAGQRLFDLEQDSNALAALSARPPAAAQDTARPKAGAPGSSRSVPMPLSPATVRVQTGWAPPSQPAVLWAPESQPLPLPAAAKQASDAQAEAPAGTVSDLPAWARPDTVAEPARAHTSSASPEATLAPEATQGLAPLTSQLPVAAAAAAEPVIWAAETAATAEEQDTLAMESSIPASEPAASAPAEPEPTPGFVLRADRAARWRHPARRGSVALLSLLLAVLLAAQMALHYRDSVAATWPASRPWLQAACDALGCRIETPRRIDSLSVDSSGLVRVEGSRQYRLSLVVHNRAPTAVRMPAIDLALTDTQGQTMARRVLLAAELGNPAESLPARGEVTLQAMLELGEERVAGYTVELFYP